MHLIWLRTDLRLHDNTALAAACQSGKVAALYLITPQQWLIHNDAPCKVDFWLRNLKHLRQTLGELNIPLLIRTATTWHQAPTVLSKLCHELSIESVHINEEYGIHENQRDAAVAKTLKANGVTLHSYLDQIFFQPGTVLTKTGTYFQVFSQFRKACYNLLSNTLPHLVATPKAQTVIKLKSDPIPEQVVGFIPPSKTLQAIWPAGEKEAHERLNAFVDQQIKRYKDERNFPAKTGTSQLSAYLAAGMISPRQCLHAALQTNDGELENNNIGAITWINELLWREFYKHILVGYPRVSRHLAFRRETEAVVWRQAPNDLAAWQEARTGLPIIDAAMRQLLEIGWMHNRLRMIVAMFLTKNLLIDWREGERFFMRHLIDGDLAANNGGWQWSASTGTDAVPYFRIFNPLKQSKKFDSEGMFIKHWLPELTTLNKKEVHNPEEATKLFGVVNYPRSIIDLKQSRKRAIAAFHNLPSYQGGR
ncbi:deoxyribodipyrimidine photo-lyase [Candidatus Pseudomonas adelgestsugas]|uniref:Deoxyribodipyrimidine photo-lyase n=1 Tax=Candidatus Pseudomonas adelgestsugas TaxID=1302376 RepID=A0ABX5R8K0_9PSED|nr:deoxyribodipyrimidine photo-lyase [Candidatus Pseudomonas adelgestsugas]QAX81757.1 Deoxyribodipyrimidine photo-lyase [Candidatus Pseudomonas adelgestsugas]